MALDEATTDEKAYLRTDGQFSRLYLAFPQPTVVFKARIADSDFNIDMAVAIPYDTIDVPGSWANIIPNMTLLVGSGDEEYDLGIARIRKEATADTLYIGEESEVQLTVGAYLTVIDEYGLWPRHKYVQSGEEHIDYMDYDIAYDDNQHSTLDPVPVLGPDRVLFYKGTLAPHPGNSISAQMDASESYCLSSSGGKTYSWVAATGTVSNASIANPTIHFHAPGTHRVSCEVTIGGKSFTGRRVVVVYDDTSLPVSDFKLVSCSGDYQSGGWSFKVTMYDNADLDLVRDRAQVILFARDWYGDVATTLTSTAVSFEASSRKIKKASGLGIFHKGATVKVSGSVLNSGLFTVGPGSGSSYIITTEPIVDEGAGDSITIQLMYERTEVSLGQVPGCENILTSGWIDKEDLRYNVDGGVATFTAHGPNYWLDQMGGFISGLRYSATPPTEWNYMQDLTVDRGIWDLLHWRSTATVMMDVFLTGDTRLAPTMESLSVGTLWEQIAGQANSTILAVPCCDRYGRLFVEINGQYVPIGERAFISVMTIEAYDRIGEIELERTIVRPVGTVDLSGVWFDGTDGYAVRGLASGHIVGRYGKVEGIEKILVTDQDQCTELAALILAQRNNMYSGMDIKLACNMRLVDICPQQQLFIVTETDMNPREVTVSNNVFVRRVSFSLDDKSKSITVDINGEPETTAVYSSVVGAIPIIDTPPLDYPDYPFGSVEFPPITFPPLPRIPSAPPSPIPDNPNPEDCLDDAGVTGPYYAGWDRTWIDGDPATPDTHSAFLWMSGTIRSGTADHPTYIAFPVGNRGTSYQHLHIYGVDASKARVATGTLTPVDTYNNIIWLKATFNLPSATNVAGFELAMDVGYDTLGPEIIMPVASCWVSEYGDSHAEITHDAEAYKVGANQGLYYWGGDVYGAGLWWYYCALVWIGAQIELEEGLSSKIWCFLTIIISGGVAGMKDTTGYAIIPEGPDYGPGVGNHAFYGPPFYFYGWLEEEPVTSAVIDIEVGIEQTTNENPSTRGQTVHVEGTLQLFATDSTPSPWRVGLGTAIVNNICPA